jgi:iron complex transport system ATP-binding protein
MNGLVAENLAFGYPGHPVGSGVSLSLRAGEVVALLGPNGGGKTTLFRTLLGLLPSQGGRVLLEGVDLATLPRAEVARRIAYVPQAHTGYFPFVVLDVVTMGRTAHLGPFGGPGAHDREAARAALERVGIARLAEAIYTRISGGERQLVLIARALAQGAPLIVMDEPTASLDFGNQVRVLEEIHRLRAAGTGIVLSTHRPDDALHLADRVLLLHRGRLLADAAPAQAITRENLREVYGVDVELRMLDLAAGTRRSVCVAVGTAGTDRPDRARTGSG